METVKGFRDIEASKRIVIRNVIEGIFKLYNFKPIETPIIESEKFVKGETTSDEIISDIFKLQDKGKRKLALRYEFTFQLKRLAKNKKIPYRRYQIGPVFRDEPITGNRWRQFTQCDVDIVGSDAKSEAEILSLTKELLNKLKIKFTISVNNKKLLNEILDEQKIKEKEAVIKEIDKLDKLFESEVRKNLKKFGAEKLLSIFKKSEKYFEKYKSYSEIQELKRYCQLYNVKVKFQPSLARGLSYYNGTVFEIKGSLKETIAAGGSYLVNGIQSTGISFGLDRLELLAKIKLDNSNVLVISLNQDKRAIKLVDKMRKIGVACSIMFGKPGKALEYANSYNIPSVIFIGKEEVKKGKVKLRNMRSGKERLVSEKLLFKSIKNINKL